MSTVIYATADSVFWINVYGQLPTEGADEFSIIAEPLDKITILVAGHAPRAALEPILITIKAPNGNLVGFDQLIVDSDFNYITKIKTNAKSWNVNGAYKITAHQGPAEINNFVSTDIEIVDGLIADFKIDYQIDGGFVSYIEVEPNSNSLIISIDTKIYDDTSKVFDGVEGGVLIIELPRKVIDAKIMDTDIDDKFVVLVDGENTPYEETIASSVRTLTIPFPYGSNEVKIMGSSVDSEYGISIVPEFGTIAPLVLMVSVVAIVAFSLKGKFSILYPKQ